MNSETLFKKIFSTIDKDGDGTISEPEVSIYFKALGLTCTDAEVQACVKHYDTDGDGTIDMDEFVNVTTRTSTALVNNDDKAKELFQKLFGKEKSVTPLRLEVMFKLHGYNPSEQEIKDLLKQADVDGDGDVTFEEFMLKMAEILLKR